MTGPTDNMRLLGDVNVNVSVELGRTQMPLQDVLALTENSIVSLNRLTDELLDVLVNGKPIAKAEIVTQDGRFALKVVELIEKRAPSAPPKPSSPPAETPSAHKLGQEAVATDTQSQGAA